MKKWETDSNVSSWIRERYDLVIDRVKEIRDHNEAPGEFAGYFSGLADRILLNNEIYTFHQNDSFRHLPLKQLEEINSGSYRDIFPENYNNSFADPAYATARLGEVLGPYLSWLTAEVYRMTEFAYDGDLEQMAAVVEMAVEVYNRFEERVPEVSEIKDIIYWYISDYSDLRMEHMIRATFDPEYGFYKSVIMTSDLSDISYLYRFGAYISENEIRMAQYLNSLDQSVIDAMADTLVDGFIRSFEVYRLPSPEGKNIKLMAPVGFERVTRSLITKLEAHRIGTVVNRSSYSGTSANRQFTYDHRQDRGLYFDKALSERILGALKVAYEDYKDLAAAFAGPVSMETFGEQPFEPDAKRENVSMSEKQQKIFTSHRMKSSELFNNYVDPETTSYAMIAWPSPEIGHDFESIMNATIKVNNLDNDLYRNIQQKIIDACDGAACMHVLGMNGNTTDIRVSLWQLKDRAKETAFENCCADVNIPAGEVFTSPVLKGTEGILNVSSVYLEGINYKNLTIRFKDGMTEECSCDNYASWEENQAFLNQNLLRHHPALPMGEFAIGTNTVAYQMAQKYDIGGKLPILIMEKTGPHFAVGDTCYSHIEDMSVYNQDGKEIMARENERSALRTSEPDKAYFHVHTDITIPYNEVGLIQAVFDDGHTTDIIRNGIFVLEGTEILNDSLQ